MTGRFVKGQSGNPKGRPKKAVAEPAATTLDIIVDRTLRITKNGRQQDVSMQEALQHQTYRQAIAGNKMARREVLKMIRQRDAYLRKQAAKKPAAPVLRRIETDDPDNANEAMLILGIVSVDGDSRSATGHTPPVKLEPWAVQAALGRRRGGAKLTDSDVQEIKRCTRAPAQIKWPRGTDA